MKIVISSGHGLKIRGAAGSPIPPCCDEVNEARKIVEAVAEYYRAAGVGVVTFHDDVSTSQSANLDRIVNFHNSQTRDLDISVHLNAYNKTAHGVEVLHVSQQSLAAKTSAAIANAGGFTDRGAKYNGGLAFLNGTEEPALLLEVFFCDHAPDCEKYRAHFSEIAKAIAEATSGVSIPSTPHPPEPPDPGPDPGPEPLPPAGQVSIAITAPPGVVVNVTQATAGGAA